MIGQWPQFFICFYKEQNANSHNKKIKYTEIEIWAQKTEENIVPGY